MNSLVVTSLISTLIALGLLIYVISQNKSKESLCLCDNLGNGVYKPYNTSASCYSYNPGPFGF